ncbi:DUF4139 domain-containing protein [Calidithermus roseus]|uniref:DUF4139 domain-containing protein n=1 Tax=Calidithermus roseus TaxID=1644118 RepID=A0A399F2H3_9DEIN|nr:hypothetical protein [Calidithermus roseus]RIH88821.1 hypothetical protein Mrose_00651 [Calidithermus roseus]
MQKQLLAALTLALGISVAQEATIYRTFAEVRQPVTLPAGSWTWEPSQVVLRSLIAGTLELGGVEELSRLVQVLPQTSPLSAYRGAKVQFYWEGQWREATVVDPDRPIFEYEGRYLTTLPGLIAYPDPAGLRPTPAARVTFSYRGSGPASLSYLSRGLTWKLYYTLEGANLTGWAALENNLGQVLEFKRVELVAGSVPVLEGGFDQPVPPAQALESRAAALEKAGAEFVGEAGGTYRYRLPGALTLQPGQTELPFLQAGVQPTYTWRWQSGFTSAPEIRFERGYRFAAPENLAGGLVSVRDQDVFVGQAFLPETAKGGLVALWLGPDPEGRAERRIEVLAQNRFRVSTTVKNSKQYGLEVELSESFPQPFTLEISGAERTPEGYRVRFTLAPGASRVLTYTVTLPR